MSGAWIIREFEVAKDVCRRGPNRDITKVAPPKDSCMTQLKEE